mmetsp:Transcript_65630/g.203181  ORF Transcript_65630/g.203181 Transcript_65630/m.203181 type:complete len:335 (+) Transcript_65630:84-1088(+)
MTSGNVFDQSQIIFGVCSWMICSVGMMVFNKLAVQAFPMECTLVALQMAFSVLVMLIFCWHSLHVGSFRDVLRWSMVVPFYTGMLLTSILALKNAPMTLVVTFRVLSPLLSLGVERFYPNPIRVNSNAMAAIVAMVMGTVLYASKMPSENWAGVEWVLLNMVFAVGDRLLQRLMLAQDQQPVDISKTGVTLLNNLEGMVPILFVAWFKGEIYEVPQVLAHLGTAGWVWIFASCVVGAGISYCGIWAQSMISATSFLVLVNANKFAIIFLEVTVLHVKSLHPVQVIGALVSVLAGVWYGAARSTLEASAKAEASGREAGDSEEADETRPLVAKKV